MTEEELIRFLRIPETSRAAVAPAAYHPWSVEVRRGITTLGGTRFEQTAVTPSKTPISETRGTKSGTPKDASADCDPDLALIVRRWPVLPAEVREAILRMASGERSL